MYKYKLRVSFKHKNNIGNHADYVKTFTFLAKSKQHLKQQATKEISMVLSHLSYGANDYGVNIVCTNKTKVR